jgi:murein DD-endopeptidase MepM/ murein hydrolase activator NlpD
MSSTDPTGSDSNMQWHIGGSVGRWDKGAANAKEDVETVQDMLRHAALILNDTRLDPGTLDGAIGHDAANSDTVQAIEAFQSRFMSSPDGRIDVGGRTWNELVNAIENGTPADAPQAEADDQPAGAASCFFPFDHLPEPNWTAPPRSFASNRGGGRAHAACDLYFPVGTIIHAIADGKVVRGPYPFYAGTFAIEIDHGDFIARYGEVQPGAFVKQGEQVKACQPLAKVGRLNGMTVSMLHLELYDKSASGPLTVSAAQSGRAASGRPYLRRKDLMDPTSKLNEWRNNLVGDGS